MNNTITYLNTDLDLISSDDLTELAEALKAAGVRALHVTNAGDGNWYAIFETYDQHSEPDANIAQMLRAIESLDEPLQRLWRGCALREFNIGYDCGAEPWAFNQGLSNERLQRLAAVGASLRFTLYPDRNATESEVGDVSI